LSGRSGCVLLGDEVLASEFPRSIIQSFLALEFRYASGMANRWKIPASLELEVRERDLACVYCGDVFTHPPISRRRAASWEHIINDASIVTRENIALCCVSCNASKGQKPLDSWLQGSYCLRRGITPDTVAQVVKEALCSCSGR